MAVITPATHARTIEIRGTLGKPNELGEMWCGWSECGEFVPEAGVYQVRRSQKGTYNVRMKHYHGANPQTVPQQNNRSKFAQAIAAWQALSEPEKAVWNKKRYPTRMTGYNRFLRHFMLN